MRVTITFFKYLNIVLFFHISWHVWTFVEDSIVFLITKSPTRDNFFFKFGTGFNFDDILIYLVLYPEPATY